MTALTSPRYGYPAALVLVAATVAGLQLFPELTDAVRVLCLLLAVFLVSWVWESGPGLLAAGLATVCLNFFFFPPVHTFTIENPRDVAALLVFLAAALLIGRLSAISRIRLRLLESERRDLIALTGLSQSFLTDTNRETLLGVAAERLRKAFECRAVSIELPDETGLLVARASAGDPGQANRKLAELAFQLGQSAVLPSTQGGHDVYAPIQLGVHRLGALVALGVSVSQRMVEGCTSLLALALERERFLKITRTTEEIRARDEIKSTILATLAHDLKTPVTGARVAIENLKATIPSEEAEQALASLVRLSRMIEELLKVVRLESGTAHPRTERVSGAAILEAAVARFGDALANHSFEVDPAPPDTFLEADPAQITEALGLLLENAGRYSPKGSRVRLTLLRGEGSLSFRVADSGPGIPFGDRERAFEKFARLASAKDVPGSGLGLYIARSLVELNGGRLELAAAAPVAPLTESLRDSSAAAPATAGGATFEIVLPAVDPR